MKKLLCMGMVITLLLVGVLALVACGGAPSTPTPPTAKTITFTKGGETEYVFIYKDGDTAMLRMARSIVGDLVALTGIDRTAVKILPDSDEVETNGKEILVGETNRKLSKEQTSFINEETEDFRWSIATDGTRLSLNANSTTGWEKLREELATMVKGDRLSAKQNYKKNSEYLYADYLADLAEKEAIQLEELRQELNKKIPELTELLASFDIEEDFGGTAVTTFPAWKKDGKTNGAVVTPTVSPEAGEHPRLLFTKDDIPGMKAALKADESLNNTFMQRVKRDIGYGVLGYARIYSNGVYNYNASMLECIQAKALYYQISGIEYYGYEALLSMKNYLKTLAIGYWNSDQCRYFGNVAYIAACVYDWCYDLMTEDDKLQLQVGVENKCLKGKSGDIEYEYYAGKTDAGKVLYDIDFYASGSTTPVPHKQENGDPAPTPQSNLNKMEIGFPPSHSGALFGHNSEYQLLRDYMSFSLAIFDEVPSWWNYCGGRYFDQYYPARQYFYSEEAAIYPEGTACYAPWRFVCDMYAVWMVSSLMGEVPFGEGLHQVPYSFYGHETEGGGIFATGDGNGSTLTSTYGAGAMMIAYLYDDPILYANAYKTGISLYYGEQLILRSNGVEPADESECTSNFDVFQYNGGHYGQVIMRETWSDARSDAIVLMKGAGKMNGGHDHADFGSFQIYYKGNLTTEDGIYDTWGGVQHFYYHAATASHNCVLVYATNARPHSNYNGGQRNLMVDGSRPNGRENVTQWRDFPEYQMGKTTGLAMVYANEEKTQAKYTYYQNDLTTAYYNTAVAFYNRTMLAVYTGDEDVPMVMLVFDNIEGKKAEYQKTFLLQCVAEPKIDEDAKTVTIDNGTGGKLVLTSLFGGDKFYAYGRTSLNGKVDPAKATGSERYYLSGINKAMQSSGGLSSGGKGDNTKAWGHVEICPNKGNTTDYLLNAIYVTDSDKNPDITVKGFEGKGCIGATVGNVISAFATTQDMQDEEISFSTAAVGKFEYYIGGLAAGKWQVKIGGSSVGTFDVKEGEHVLSFEGRAGRVTITPVD